MSRIIVIASLLVLVSGCASDPPTRVGSDDNESVSAVWRFDFFDTDDRSIGHIVFAFTTEEFDDRDCKRGDWSKAVILEDALDFDFRTDVSPAYFIRGAWLRVDLTAESCSINHNMIGDIKRNKARGFFTMSHQLGGDSLGKFTGRALAQDDWPVGYRAPPQR